MRILRRALSALLLLAVCLSSSGCFYQRLLTFKKQLKKFEDYFILEEQEDWPISRSHAYPSLTFQNGNAHLTYWETHEHGEAERLFHLVYRRLSIAWFYKERPRRAPVYDVARDMLCAKTVYDGEERE